MTRLGLVAALASLSGSVLLSGCQNAPPPPASGQAQADAQTRMACQQRAEQAYDQQNRADIYSPQSSVNTPFSANYTPGISDRGLSQVFAHDRMVNDCIRNTGTGAERAPPGAPVNSPPGTRPPAATAPAPRAPVR
jgi:hypothetical protein